MDLNLIDVDDDYYKDDLQFKDPGQLKSIFNKLELKNLTMIGKMQENEQAYENQVQKENDIKKEMETKYVTQNANRIKLQKSINEAKELVKLSQKKIKQGTILMENAKDNSHATKKKGPDADKQSVDVDKMLDSLRKQIIAIYKREIGGGDDPGKKTITLLNVSVFISN